jgi:hypothetical protein
MVESNVYTKNFEVKGVRGYSMEYTQWLQDPSEINGDGLNNVRIEASRYLKDKVNVLALNSKNIRDLCRGINEFKRGYQPRSNLVKDENGDLLADLHNILNR